MNLQIVNIVLASVLAVLSLIVLHQVRIRGQALSGLGLKLDRLKKTVPAAGTLGALNAGVKTLSR